MEKVLFLSTQDFRRSRIQNFKNFIDYTSKVYVTLKQLYVCIRYVKIHLFTNVNTYQIRDRPLITLALGILSWSEKIKKHANVI